MDAKFGGKLPIFYDPVVSKAMGKKSVEWDLNDWRWDGDLFTATPSNESVFENERRNRDLEKRRRNDDEVENDENGSLSLKLGVGVYPVTEGRFEGKSGKKTEFGNYPVCQVENCKEDLRNGKDYHRRHKVCGVHSKATSALVGNVMQRFCQQCSRFHILQEFDEGKRSCRRRLAGHNKRRRKTHPDNDINVASLNDEQGSNNLLISLLRILSNIQSNNTDQTKDRDLLSHLLKNLANVASAADGQNPTGSYPVSSDLLNAGTSLTTSDPTNLPQKGAIKENTQCGVRHTETASQTAVKFLAETSNAIIETGSCNDVGKVKSNMQNFDLNNVYDVSEDCIEDARDTIRRGNHGNMSPVGPMWLQKDPQQTSQHSRNSGFTSSQSPSTSSGDAQSRTDRIVFKFFGKDPSEFPPVLRKQIFDWLSHSPTDIESYIRPGCIILTIYIRMDDSAWENLYCNLASSLRKLLDSSTDSFWESGWIYTRVRNRVTFLYNGQIVLDTPLPLNHKCCRISSIKPIAVTVSDNVKFVVKGFNLSPPTSRLQCALQGKYLVQENCDDTTCESDSVVEHDDIQSLTFCTLLPNTIGRGFIEVENEGLGSSIFPFIVAEKDVCYEIRTLESIIEAADGSDDKDKLEARNQALDFINEMGWLLHKSSLKFRLHETHGALDLFPFKRFKWLIEFSTEQDWCAVVKKLLGILFDGTVDSGQFSSVTLALLEAGILHKAVRRNCRSMVEFLLKYHPSDALDKPGPEQDCFSTGYCLFRPDAAGAGGLTPLHIAASLKNSDGVLDALTEDPKQVGIEAWKNARDSTGLTPNDYACISGHYSYVNLVQRKIDKKLGKGHISIDIPNTINDNAKQNTGNAKITPFDTEVKSSRNCARCEQKLAHGSYRVSLTISRPTMLSMVAVAAVCVCAALLFKSSPEVLCSLKPFRWELLDYGSQ